MNRSVYVANERDIALSEDGRLVEWIRDSSPDATEETILMGRVTRIVQGMQAAFVDIGQSRNGFLPLTEKSSTYEGGPIREGSHIPVQIKKAALGSKGAFLTRDITLCGSYVILMPMNHYIGVSARVTDEADRSRLHALGEAIADGRYGIVMRASALETERTRMEEEFTRLSGIWQETARRLKHAPAPSIVYHPRTALESLLDDCLPLGIDRLITDDPLLADSLNNRLPAEIRKDPFEGTTLKEQRDRALQRFVWLPCGGNLVIDPCEALTVIDVNSAKHTGKQNLEETILQVNTEACAEIARQIRLRALSGIIIVDMIDMEREEDRSAILDILAEALSHDRVKTVIHGYTSLGLIELTRKKTRLTLKEQMSLSSQCVPEETHG